VPEEIAVPAEGVVAETMPPICEDVGTAE
jgi:hypothetical protein